MIFSKNSRRACLILFFFAFAQNLKMDKPKEKKHIHLNTAEKRHVAELIANEATYNEVNSWHLMRFGKVMAKSKFYNHKVKHKKTLENKSKTNNYTRKGECMKNLKPLSSYLKINISILDVIYSIVLLYLFNKKFH